MNTPKPKAKPGPTFTDPLGEQPVIGTMNYARKFPEGATGGYAAPGMPVSVGRASYLPPKKKPSLSIASYRKGTKSIEAGGDVERATPSVTPSPDYPTATSPFSEVDNGDPDITTVELAPAESQPQALRAPLQKADSLPAPRDSGTRTPKDYKEAAAVIRGDKALYSQYKAGIASGKAFSLSVGGKTFKYAATPKQSAPAPKKMMKAAGSEERAEALQGNDLPEVNLPVAPTLGKNISIQYNKEPKKMSGKKK